MFGSQHDAPDSLDYELLKGPENARFEPPKASAAGVRVAVAVLIAAIVVAGYIAFWRSHKDAPAGSAARNGPVPRESTRPLGAEAQPIVLPPLDQTDPLVRELVKQLTSHPVAAAWLTTDGLVRNFVVVVANVVDGTAPGAHLRPLRPTSTFQVIDRSGRLFIDPRSYRRYDGVAGAATSIDPAGAARLYTTLKPRLEEAYRELGNPDSFDHAVETAIVRLLQVPAVSDPVQVQLKGGTGYAYANPSLESLTGPQKQLLRMGPANVQAIQSSLRAIAVALGIPANRLPSPQKTND